MTTCRRHPEDSPRHPEESPRTALINALSIQGYPEREPRPCSLMASKPRIKIYRKFYLIVSLLFLFWHSSLFEQIDLNHFFFNFKQNPCISDYLSRNQTLIHLTSKSSTRGMYHGEIFCLRLYNTYFKYCGFPEI